MAWIRLQRRGRRHRSALEGFWVRFLVLRLFGTKTQMAGRPALPAVAPRLPRHIMDVVRKDCLLDGTHLCCHMP